MIEPITDRDVLEPFLNDASNLAGGYAERLFFPRSTQDVVDIVRESSRTDTPVTIAGAGTGLSGARIPHGGAVVSLSRMNDIVSIDSDANSATVQPGVVLENLQTELSDGRMLYPPDPTERGGQIGGNASTNASGARTFKYGPTRDWVDAAEIVLANGDIVQLRRGEQTASNGFVEFAGASGRSYRVPIPAYNMPETSKHAAGYYVTPNMDALDLFVGSEGTLGIFTELRLRLVPAPEQLLALVAFFDDEENMLQFVETVRDESVGSRANGTSGTSGRIEARAIEFIDGRALDFIRENWSIIPEGTDGGAIWIEQEATEETAEDLLMSWSEVIERHTGLYDATWAGLTESEQNRMRKFRHAVPSAAYEFITSHGIRKFGTDIAVPSSAFREMYGLYRRSLDESGIVNLTWGHIGNAHLHVNMLPRGFVETERAQQLYDFFVENALRLGGTVSAEHGIGKLKKKYLRQMFGEEGIAAMRAVKESIDPDWILGRGTMFDRD